MRSRFARKAISLLLLVLLWNTPLLRAQTAQDKEQEFVKKSLERLGTSMGTFGYTLLNNSRAASESFDNEDRKALEKMVRGYKNGVEAGRGTIGLLDTTLEIAITGTELYTGGAALVATAGVRYAKNVGLNYLMDKIEEDQRKFLAANLNSFEQKSGLTFDVLATKSPSEIMQAIDKVDEFKAMKDKLNDDPKARALFENSIIDTIKNVSKATLQQVAQNTGDVNELQNRMAKMDRKFSRFVDQTNSALTELSDQLGQTQIDIERANRSIDQLRRDTNKNTEQLQALSEVAFSNGSAHDRLILLNGGYLKDVLSEPDRNALIDSVKSQAKKEEIVAQMGTIVNDFSKVSRIASNIGLPLPDEINQAIAFAETASKAISDVVSGDYLGAIVGITGLFGPPRPDPAALRHQQLMNFLKENFAQINEKLDRIIEGQQKIMQGIAALSEQAAEYDRALHERLDRIEFQLDTIQAIVRENLYRPLGTCGDTRQQIINRIGNEDTTKTFRILGTSSGISSGVKPCAEYLRALFYQTFDPDRFDVSPLAIRFSRNAGNTGQFAISQETQNKYFDNPTIKKFLENQYKPQSIFFLNQSTKFQLKPHTALAVLALPARNIASVNKKLSLFTNSSPACSKGTLLSDPLLALACFQNGKPTPSRLNIPENSSSTLEDIADQRSINLLNNVLAHDDTATLAEWALFYAPLYDIYDFKDNRIPASERDLFNLLADESFAKNTPNGQILLRGALRVITVSLAQMNMLYGDVTAKMVFQNLWDSANKKFLPAPGIPDNCKPGAENDCKFADLSSPQQAFLIFKNNPYVQRNVLMLGLNETSKLNGPGQNIAYDSALEWMKTAAENVDGQLRAAFGEGWEFKNLIKEGLDKDGKKVNIKFPAAVIYGVDITLPTVDDFNNREFSYPYTLRRMLATRDLIANRIADYEAIDWSVKDAADPERDRQLIVNTLIKVTN